MNFKPFLFLLSFYFAIPSDRHDVEAIVHQVGEKNTVAFDDQKVRIKNELNEEGEISTKAEIYEEKHNPFDEMPPGIFMNDDIMFINYDYNHKPDPQVQIINDNKDHGLFETLESLILVT